MINLKSVIILARLNTSEWLRLKFFHVIVFLAALLIVFSFLLSSLTFSVQMRLMFDFGLAGLELALIMLASLIGTHSIQREIDRKTLLVLLSRPIPRSHLVLASWLSVMSLSLLFCFGFILSLHAASDLKINLIGLMTAALGTFLKAGIVASFAIACALIVRPMLALAASVCYWVLCYSLPDIEFFISKIKNELLSASIQWAHYFVPKFHLYNWKSYYYIQNAPAAGDIVWAVAHSLTWVFFWLLVASLFFRRKEIV